MDESAGPSWGARALAVIIFVVAAWFLLKFVIHVAIAIASTVAIVAAVIGLIWAWRTLSR